MVHVHSFLWSIRPSLTLNIVPISDPYGPAAVDELLDTIVVSKETEKGGAACNTKRAENKLGNMRVVVIDLVAKETEAVSQENGAAVTVEDKMSSSQVRKSMLGRLRAHPRGWCPKNPYVVGVTGGIASGKSTAVKELHATFGAAVIDCDKLGHQAYAKGSETLAAIVTAFGADILTPEGEVNRAKLGPIVFGSKDEMDKLNGIVWPAIASLVDNQLATFAREGVKLVVMEAAVLIEASWQYLCDEVWVVVAPTKLRLDRLCERCDFLTV